MMSPVLEDRSKVDQLSDCWEGMVLPCLSAVMKERGKWLSAYVRTQRGMWVHVFIYLTRKIHYEF